MTDPKIKALVSLVVNIFWASVYKKNLVVAFSVSGEKWRTYEVLSFLIICQ
jgi:hypothetical protein